MWSYIMHDGIESEMVECQGLLCALISAENEIALLGIVTEEWFKSCCVVICAAALWWYVDVGYVYGFVVEVNRDALCFCVSLRMICVLDYVVDLIVNDDYCSLSFEERVKSNAKRGTAALSEK